MTIALAAAMSAALHASFLFGSMFFAQKPAPVARDAEPRMIQLALPELRELEEPETIPSDDPAPLVDLAVPVPMQADVPSLPSPNDFVQVLNFASLIEKPDFSQLALKAIPENYIRSGRLAEKIGKIFNLADLDRTPEPILQGAPFFPHAMKREGVSGRVQVEFVVDTDGRVLDPQVVESTASGFDHAAISAVSRWKFRPGVKNGRKVATRMSVPIVFAYSDEIN